MREKLCVETRVKHEHTQIQAKSSGDDFEGKLSLCECMSRQHENVARHEKNRRALIHIFLIYIE